MMSAFEASRQLPFSGPFVHNDKNMCTNTV